MISFHFRIKKLKNSLIWVYQSLFSLASRGNLQVMPKVGWMKDLMIWRTIIFTFCLLQSQTRDQSKCKNFSHSKAQFLAERNLRSTRDFYIYIMIYKPFLDFIRIKISICYDILECWIFRFQFSKTKGSCIAF